MENNNLDRLSKEDVQVILDCIMYSIEQAWSSDIGVTVSCKTDTDSKENMRRLVNAAMQFGKHAYIGLNNSKWYDKEQWLHIKESIK